jgi:hypothetical protein
MALSVQDLDALLGYDPASHSVKGMPTLAPQIPPKPAGIPSMSPAAQNNMSLDMATSGMRTAHPAMPSAGASGVAPVAAAAPTAPDVGIPSVGASAASLPGEIPSLAKPTTAQSHAAGKAEYAEGIPTVTAAPGTEAYGQQRQELLDYQKAHPWGADVSAHPGTWGKIAHGLERGVEIAGDVVAPGTMANIPGTQLNEQRQAKQNEGWINLGQQDELKNAQAKLANAQTWGAMNPGAKTVAEDQAGMSFRAQAAEGLGLKPGTPEYQRFVGTGAMSPSLPGKTPAEQTYDSLIGQPNPATGKPYTAQEALAEVTKAPPSNETAEDSRYEGILTNQKLGKPVSPEDNAWADSYRQRKALGPQATAAAGAQNATLTPLLNPNTGQITGTFNTKTGDFKPATQNMGGATTAAGAGVGNKQVEAFNKDYVNPAEAIERSYQMFEDAYKAIQNGDAKTGAEDMLLLSQHLGTTFGQVKGSRMNKDLIQEHKDAIGIQDKIERYSNNIASGQMLSPDQRKEFGDLISNMRNLTWRIATKEAARNNQPINFLPADVQVNMRDSRGISRPVTGDRVQEYLDKGAQLAN